MGHAVTTRDSIDVNHLGDGHCNYSLLEQVKTMRLERGTKILVVKSSTWQDGAIRSESR